MNENISSCEPRETKPTRTGVIFSVMELSWLLCLIALLLVLLLFYYSYVFEPYQVFKRLGIPGPPPKVLYGNYKQLAQFEGGVGGLKSQEYRETQYGSVCGYYIGYDPYLMITEPEMIREFLVQRFNNFTNRPPILVQFLKTPTLVNARDAKVWRKLRQIISPTFTIRKLRMMESLMSRPIDRFLSKVEKAESTLSSIDIHTSMFELATEILLAAFFGKAADIQGDELGKRLVKCISVPFTASKDGGSVDVFKGIAFISAFPFLRHLANIGIKKSSVGKAISELYVVSGEIVEERKRSTLSHNDFLQQIMGSDLKSDDVRTQVVSMILGGNETVTSALTSAAYLLAIHPDVQDKLIQEISEYFKGNPESTLNDAIELPYLDMVVNEVLRMYPPFTRTARECEKECVLGGYTIPAGMYIDIPIYYLHHHPAYWTDPYVFNPERFSSENKDKIQPFTYLPFSDGPRNCIGMRFALMEIKMVLIQILRKHKFMRFPDTQVPMRMKNGITLGPNDPVMLGFQSHD